MSQMSDRGRLREVIRALRILRSEMPFMSVAGALTFLSVVEDEGKHMQDYAVKLGYHRNTVHRQVIDLSDQNRHRQKGPDLLRTEESPEDRRAKTVYLSPKGRIIARRITEGEPHGQP